MSITNYLDNEQNRLSFKECDFLHYLLNNEPDNVYNQAARFGVNVDTILSKLQRQKVSHL